MDLRPLSWYMVWVPRTLISFIQVLKETTSLICSPWMKELAVGRDQNSSSAQQHISALRYMCHICPLYAEYMLYICPSVLWESDHEQAIPASKWQVQPISLLRVMVNWFYILGGLMIHWYVHIHCHPKLSCIIFQGNILILQFYFYFTALILRVKILSALYSYATTSLAALFHNYFHISRHMHFPSNL
jgi:hypothetical protein